MSLTTYACAKTMRARAFNHFDLAGFPHVWADLSHFLHVSITFDALSIGVVVSRSFQVVIIS